MAVRHEIIPVRLADGVTMHVEATMLGGEEEVAFNLLSFKDVTDTCGLCWLLASA